MELTNHPLMRFLRDELSLPSASINLAFQQARQTPSLMPMVLWQYGLVSLPELDRILDWLDGQSTTGYCQGQRFANGSAHPSARDFV